MQVEIHVVDNNVEKAIRVLKRKLQQEGLFREMKQRKFYEKPSVKRKRKEKEAQRRLRKKMRLMRKDWSSRLVLSKKGRFLVKDPAFLFIAKGLSLCFVLELRPIFSFPCCSNPRRKGEKVKNKTDL